MVNWFEYPSNFSNGTNVDGIGSFFHYANHVTNGVAGGAILFLTFAISFMVMKGTQSVERAFAASGFITSLIGILLYRIELVPLPIVITLIIFTVVGIILARNENVGGRI